MTQPLTPEEWMESLTDGVRMAWAVNGSGTSGERVLAEKYVEMQKRNRDTIELLARELAKAQHVTSENDFELVECWNLDPTAQLWIDHVRKGEG